MNLNSFSNFLSTCKPVKIPQYRQKSLNLNLNILIIKIFKYNLFKSTLKNNLYFKHLKKRRIYFLNNL